MATADRMSRDAAAKRKATSARISSTRARARRVTEVERGSRGSSLSRPTATGYTNMRKVSTKRKITTPKRGSQTTRRIEVGEPGFSRYTKSALTKFENRGSEGPKRPQPKKRVSKMKYGKR